MRDAFPIAAIAAVSTIDQLTKAMAREALTPGRPVEVAPFFNLTLGFNEGVVFGMGADLGWGPWPLIVLTATIAIGFSIWLFRETNNVMRGALALLVGGAVGNLLDRVLRGAVTDFLDFHAGGVHWPSFNLADSAIVVGVGLLVWESSHRTSL
ncbi:signal peptidase II [Brevundimonas aveniformis]|uniref:signal peptidase II n=1 Tax=Brevundimonas aveniformis TaxID=370977 RepID=UPI00042048F7|nr:signal peptidase II [Brevundimonas aveniformis]